MKWLRKLICYFWGHERDGDHCYRCQKLLPVLMTAEQFLLDAKPYVTGKPARPIDINKKLPIDRPCSACSAGDYKMEFHDHEPPYREDSDPEDVLPSLY